MNFISLAEDFKTWGPIRFIHFYTMYALRPWLFLCLVGIRPLATRQQAPILAPNRRISIAGEADLTVLNGDEELGVSQEFVTDAFARGDICVAAFEAEKIVAFRWFATTGVPHSKSLQVEIGKDIVYGYKAETRSNYRRQKLQEAITQFAANYLLQVGKTHMGGFIETHNFASIQAVFGDEYQFSGYAGYVSLFGKYFCFRTRRARKIGFRFYDARKHSKT